jgi:hypothetical protein
MVCRQNDAVASTATDACFIIVRSSDNFASSVQQQWASGRRCRLLSLAKCKESQVSCDVTHWKNFALLHPLLAFLDELLAQPQFRFNRGFRWTFEGESEADSGHQ